MSEAAFVDPYQVSLNNIKSLVCLGLSSAVSRGAMYFAPPIRTICPPAGGYLRIEDK
jgi:hypothetical protein